MRSLIGSFIGDVRQGRLTRRWRTGRYCLYRSPSYSFDSFSSSKLPFMTLSPQFWPHGLLAQEDSRCLITPQQPWRGIGATIPYRWVLCEHRSRSGQIQILPIPSWQPWPASLKLFDYDLTVCGCRGLRSPSSLKHSWLGRRCRQQRPWDWLQWKIPTSFFFATCPPEAACSTDMTERANLFTVLSFWGLVSRVPPFAN